MKFVIYLVLLSVGIPARGQQIAVVDRDAEVRAELTRQHYSPELYNNCDVVRRVVDRAVARHLAIRASEQNRPAQRVLHESIIDVDQSRLDQNETAVAISRVDPRIIVIGSNETAEGFDTETVLAPAYRSSDGGQTWKTYRLPWPTYLGTIPWGDPSIVCDDKGTFYYGLMLLKIGNTGHIDVSDLAVAHSTDGIEWTLGGPVAKVGIVDSTKFIVQDKETIAIDRDPKSPHYGRLYIAWLEFFDDSAKVCHAMFASSDDKGATWTKPVPISGDGGFFQTLHVGPGGILYINGSTNSNGANSGGSMVEPIGYHVVNVSRDGGATFEQDTIAQFTNYPKSDIYHPGIKAGKRRGIRSFPYNSLDLDPVTGKLYVAYSSATDSVAALFATSSNTEGRSWSVPARIGSPSAFNTDHFQPWVSYDATRGTAVVTFYSSEADKDSNVLSQAAQVEFIDPGTVYPLSSIFDPLVVQIFGSPFIGDYIGSDAFGGTFAAAWTEPNPKGTHDGDIIAYVRSNGAGVSRPVATSAFEIEKITPNPVFGESVEIKVTPVIEGPIDVSLYDLRGEHIKTSVQSGEGSIIVSVKGLAAGVYRCVVSIAGRTKSQNIVVIH